jgi:hypothetical protein
VDIDLLATSAFAATSARLIADGRGFLSIARLEET